MKHTILILITFLLISCGARQKEKTTSSEVNKTEKSTAENSKKETQIKTNSDINIKKSEVKTVDDQNQIITETETIEPIDYSKPASYIDENGKKQDLYNSKKTKTKTIQNNNIKTNSEVRSDLKDKTNSVAKENEYNSISKNEKADYKKDELTNNVKRDSWSLWWLLIPLGVLGLCYFGFKKYKDKIWWV